MQIGFIGLGKMGINMVFHLLENGVEVVAWNRSQDDLLEVSKKGAVVAKDHKDLIDKLKSPRVIWIMVPQGTPVDEMIEKLLPHLKSGDLLIDGGNSFYGDTLKRNKLLSKKGIHFMDIGVSGGPSGARNGACLMIGGKVSDFEKIKPIAKILSSKDAYSHLGDTGAGHFAKMVHNGIEYGMMQSIAEGAAVLKKSDFKYDLEEVFRIYNNRSVIESRLVGWSQNAFKEDENLSKISSKINATGEGEWTINVAKKLKIKVPIIEESLEVRKRSNEKTEDFRDKVVSALRGQFGGHLVTKVK